MQDSQALKVQQRIKRLMKQKKMAKQNYTNKLQQLSQIQIRKRAASQTNLDSSNHLNTNRQISKTKKYSNQKKNTIENHQEIQQDQQKSVRTTQWRKKIPPIKKNNPDIDKYYRQTENSQATAPGQSQSYSTQGQNKKINVQKIIQTVFVYSPKLTQYFDKDMNGIMKKEDAMKQLLDNQLFLLNITNKLTKMKLMDSNTNNGQINSSVNNQIVENQIILKLSKLQRRKKQSLMCCDVENRIKSLINHRLDALRKY